jgi:hypothetical protein
VAQPFPKVLNWVPHPSRFWCMGRVGFFGPLSTLFVVSSANVPARPHHQITSDPNPQTQSNAKAKTWPKSPTLDKPEDGAPTPRPNIKSQVKIYTAPSTPTVLSSLKMEPMIQTENTERVKGGPPATQPKPQRQNPSQNLYCSVNTSGVIIPQNGAAGSDGKYGEGKGWATRHPPQNPTSKAKSKSILLRQHQRCYHPSKWGQ